MINEIEDAYGRYLFVPFDIPKILPSDLEQFVSFYFEHARPVEKKRADIFPKFGSVTSYDTIDSSTPNPAYFNSIWSENRVPEMYTRFPELFEQIHGYLPFIDMDSFKWSMWSSNKDVIEHRDYGIDYDLPILIRSKLYDTNPYETLHLRLQSLAGQTESYPIPSLVDTNTFAWNNKRLTHASSFIPGHRKILLLFSGITIRKIVESGRLNQYIDLLDKSIHKHKDQLILDPS